LVSDIEENLEVIADSGVPFQRGNAADLKDKLELLLNNEDLVRQYRRRAQLHVQKHYNWQDVADQYEQLYWQLVWPEGA